MITLQTLGMCSQFLIIREERLILKSDVLSELYRYYLNVLRSRFNLLQAIFHMV